jgi:ferredoxin
MDMAHVITSKCVGTCDSACVDVCPCDCIVGPVPIDELRAVPPRDRGQRFPALQLFIDPDECIDCGACLPECPVEAIHHERDVPAAHVIDIERNAAFFRR